MKILFVAAIVSIASTLGFMKTALASLYDYEERYLLQVENHLIQHGLPMPNQQIVLDYGYYLCSLKDSGTNIIQYAVASAVDFNNRTDLSEVERNAGMRTLIVAGSAAEMVLCP